MKRNVLKRLFMTVISLMMAACILCSCSVIPEDEKSNGGSDSAKVNSATFTDKELETAVITIGEYKITLQEYLAFFNQIVSYYQENYDYNISESVETLNQYLDKISETLAEEKMVLYRASELGLTELSDEQKKIVDDQYKADVDELYDYYRTYAETDAKSDTTQTVEELIDQYILDEAEYYLGKGATIDDYMDYLYESSFQKYVSDLLKKEITKDIAVTDAEIEDWYNTNLEEDKTYFSETPGGYKEERESFDKVGTRTDMETGVQPLVIPEGYSRVFEICTTTDTEFSDDYKDNETEMNKYMSEYGRLALDDAVNGTKKNTQEMADILKAYKELKEANQKEYDEVFKEAKAKIDEAYAKLKAGEDFATVMEEYNENDQINLYENVKKNGLLISEHSSEKDWSNTFKEHFSKLKIGEYSEVFSDENGFHIVYYIGDEVPGELSLADIKDSIMNYLLPTMQDEAYSNKLTEWMKNEDNAIVYNSELLSRVGAGSLVNETAAPEAD